MIINEFSQQQRNSKGRKSSHPQRVPQSLVTVYERADPAKEFGVRIGVEPSSEVSPGLGFATSATDASSSSAHSTDLNSPQKWFYPFGGIIGNLEILPSSANSDMIDVEEEVL